jgi:hypothetical protein
MTVDTLSDMRMLHSSHWMVAMDSVPGRRPVWQDVGESNPDWGRSLTSEVISDFQGGINPPRVFLAQSWRYEDHPGTISCIVYRRSWI